MRTRLENEGTRLSMLGLYAYRVTVAKRFPELLRTKIIWPTWHHIVMIAQPTSEMNTVHDFSFTLQRYSLFFSLTGERCLQYQTTNKLVEKAATIEQQQTVYSYSRA